MDTQGQMLGDFVTIVINLSCPVAMCWKVYLDVQCSKVRCVSQPEHLLAMLTVSVSTRGRGHKLRAIVVMQLPIGLYPVERVMKRYEVHPNHRDVIGE